MTKNYAASEHSEPNCQLCVGGASCLKVLPHTDGHGQETIPETVTVFRFRAARPVHAIRWKGRISDRSRFILVARSVSWGVSVNAV